MRTKVAALVGTCVVATALAAGPASAATGSVTVMNFGFTPTAVTVNLNDNVLWSFKDPGVTHTSTSNQGFWNSGSKTFGQTYSKTFAYAGAFAYHCNFHSEMTGTVFVRLQHPGTASAGYRLRWSTLMTVPASLSFDVQQKKPGATTWTTLRSSTKTTAMLFNPSVNGTYAVRARTRNLNNHTASGWTPIVKLLIS